VFQSAEASQSEPCGTRKIKYEEEQEADDDSSSFFSRKSLTHIQKEKRERETG
jgi:hypothetical protein